MKILSEGHCWEIILCGSPVSVYLVSSGPDCVTNYLFKGFHTLKTLDLSLEDRDGTSLTSKDNVCIVFNPIKQSFPLDHGTGMFTDYHNKSLVP